MRSLLQPTNVLAPRILRPFVQRAFANTEAQNHLREILLNRQQILIDHGKRPYDLATVPLPLLDLRTPVPLLHGGWKQIWKNFENNWLNRISNTISMIALARAQTLPWRQDLSVWSFQILRTTSTEADKWWNPLRLTSTQANTWLNPLREIALDIYQELNSAVATRQTKVIETYAYGPYKNRLLERTKALKGEWTWKLHSLAAPVQIVSIRCQPGPLSDKPLTFGTPYFIQACVKFDTWQSLEKKKLTKKEKVEREREPQRVVEYLVFEKKMWFDAPWAVRAQLWPGVLKMKKIEGM
ncbi:hypothetical protein M422DRAFT_27753 [Sphaerobolus stellatus SS14]|nr:hypothetical protein M422DRAFT_27753 [Sphaerobolus stellatus SS14]